MNTFTAVVSNSPLSGPQISITDESGYVLCWIDIPGRAPTMAELTKRLQENDFEIEGEWWTLFQRDSLRLLVKVRSDRDDI